MTEIVPENRDPATPERRPPPTAEQMLPLFAHRLADAALTMTVAGVPTGAFGLLLLAPAAADALLAEVPRVFACAPLPPPYGDSADPIEGERDPLRVGAHAFCTWVARRRLECGGTLACAASRDFAAVVVGLFGEGPGDVDEFAAFDPGEGRCALVVVDGALRVSVAAFGVGAAAQPRPGDRGRGSRVVLADARDAAALARHVRRAGGGPRGRRR